MLITTSLAFKAPSLVFDSPQAKELAIEALTHSSASATRNNTELAKIGEAAARAVAFEALHQSPGKHSGKQYNDISLAFATKHLCAIAKKYNVNDAIRLGKGVPYISDEMSARAVEGLLGALKLSSGPEKLLQALKELGIVHLPDLVVTEPDWLA
ncbi:hypothetical protein JCM11641_003726 [Rhodosporidiobolus odoratus]